MGFDTACVSVTQISQLNWNLDRAMVYTGNTDTFTVPTGFTTDLATVPRAIAWLIPRYGTYTPAAVLHDWLCVEAHAGRFSREDADGLFRRCLGELGVSFPRRWMMWAAVRAGSRLEDASPPAIAVFTAIAVPSVLFLAIPVVLVQLWLIVFWLIELLSFAGARAAGRQRPVPAFPTTT